MAIAVVSTVVVFTALVLLVTHAPGWPTVKASFFNGHYFVSSFPEIARAFVLNIKMFCIAEVFILAFALLIAVMRSLPGPVFFPIRALAIAYADFFRGVPTILVIAMLGFGVPGLGLQGVPTSTVFWGIVSLVLVYTAYVSEVYRAGIESVHPSQEAAARSLGLTRGQALRYVILPQAVRRVVPPLLNDFIGLQKDTALEPIDRGRIVVEGEDVTAARVDANRVRRQIGIVFQAFNLFPHMTVLQNVTLAPRRVLGKARREAEADAVTLLSRFGLVQRRNDYPDRLSGGQQQRVAIVRALAMRPKLMLLDEVTSALDPELVAEVLAVIRELADGGMTMVIATHEMSFARDIADRICFLDDGVIREQGPPEQLLTSPSEPRTQQFLQRIIAAGRL